MVGCDRESNSRSKSVPCLMHYERIRRGSPMFGRKKIATAPLAERLAKYRWKSPFGCWIWIGCKTRKGYGNITVNGGYMAAHRLAWTLAKGPIPKGQFVLHRCDHRDCIRPSHLFLGTGRDNMADMTKKDRQAKGERIARAKLTGQQVLEIRRRRAHGERTEDLAREFGMSFMGVYNAAVGLTWKHLPTIYEENVLRPRVRT